MQQNSVLLQEVVANLHRSRVCSTLWFWQMQETLHRRGIEADHQFAGSHRSERATIRDDFVWKPLLFGQPTSENALREGYFQGKVHLQISY
jgi:hypothetical protein